ncbi:integrase [Photorhabdus sp. SF281]
MGWKETSGTAAIYNRRHIKEKAKEVILDFQRSIRALGADSDD